MKRLRTLSPQLLALTLMLASALAAPLAMAAQAVGQVQSGASTEPDTPSVKEIQSKIQSIKDNTALSQDVRKKALNLYQQALGNLQSAQNYQQSAQKYRRILQKAPHKTHVLENRKTQIPPLDLKELKKLSLDKLENRLSQARANLGAARARLSSLDQRISQLRTQPSATQDELNQVKEESVTAGSQTNPGAPPTIVNAEQALQRTQALVHARHIDMLQQEMLSHDARMNLLQAEQAQAQQKVHELSHQVDVLQQLVHKRRTAEAQRLAQTTQQTEQQVRHQPQPLPQLAQQNAALAQQVAQLVPRIVRTGNQRDSMHRRAKLLRKEYQRTKAQLSIAGLGHALADVLRRQMESLPSQGQLTSELHHRKAKIAQARLDQYQIEEQIEGLQQLRQQANKRLAQQQGLTGQQRAQAQTQLQQLLSKRSDLLQHLLSFYSQYVNELVSLEHEQTQLLDTTGHFSSLLKENLLWTASAQPAGLAWLQDTAQGLGWLLTPQNWTQVANALWGGLRHLPWASGGLALVIMVLLALRRRLRRILESRAAHIGNVTRDRFLFTIEGMGFTLLLALPAALAPVLPGVLITQASSAHNFAYGVGRGLVNAGILILFFESFRQFCRDGGVADQHFGWNESSRGVLMRNFWWLLMIELPVTLLVTMTNHAADAYRHGLGRLAFVVGSIALSVFFWRVLRPSGGAINKFINNNNNSWIRLLRLVGLPVIVAVPTGMAVLALSGYYFSALMLESRFYNSAWLLVGVVVGIGLALRWMNVAGRRLALARARARREAMQAERASKESAEATGEGMPENLAIPEIDLDTINEQTRSIMNLVVALILGIGLWLIWSDMLPALNVLTHVTLWTATTSTSAGKTISHITLQDLLLAAATVTFTVAAARNLPGLLEISILQRFEIDAGNRYAITTVSRYFIFAVGLLTSLKLIGIGWKQAQFLVAALGVGLGFGLQEIFANFVSGLIILFERPIRIGDTVTVGTTSGTVSRIRIRATTITDWDRKELVVPNKTFITNEVTNWTLSSSIQRIVIPIGIDYGADPAQATDIILETIKSHSLTLEEPPPAVLFMAYGDSTLNFQIRAFVHDISNMLALIHELNVNVHRALREAGINIAFPQRDLHIRSWDASWPWDKKPESPQKPKAPAHTPHGPDADTSGADNPQDTPEN